MTAAPYCRRDRPALPASADSADRQSLGLLRREWPDTLRLAIGPIFSNLAEARRAGQT